MLAGRSLGSMLGLPSIRTSLDAGGAGTLTPPVVVPIPAAKIAQYFLKQPKFSTACSECAWIFFFSSVPGCDFS